MKAKIYTKTGDKGQTSLVGGTRVSKTNGRLEAYGTLDELNSVIGMIRSHLRNGELANNSELAETRALADSSEPTENRTRAFADNRTFALADFGQAVDAALQTIQNNLFNIGSHLACEDETLRPNLPKPNSAHLAALEKDMDLWESQLPPLKNFILPGGSTLAAVAHLARTVCRRAERETIRLSEQATVDPETIVYINRLSDWLFVLAREFNSRLKVADVQWQKG